MKKYAFKRMLKILSLCFFSMFFVSCSMIFKVNEPIELLWDKADKKTDRLIIFLPGIFDSVNKFKNEYFFSEARDAGITADMVAANTNVGHLAEGVLIKRLEKDVFEYIKNDGYKNIWIVGVSIGGLSTLTYYKDHEKALCGVVVLAPYLADDYLTEEIKKVGGVKNWLPIGRMKDSVDERIEEMWLWTKSKKDFSNIFLGYGEQDQFISGSEFLAGFLEEENIITVEGGHDWETGRRIWKSQLASRMKTGLLQPCQN